MSIVHGSSPATSGAGNPLRIATLVLAALAVAGAVVVVVWPLPKPAAGGTCGPGAGSEPAIAAFFDPVSIGAGPQPTTNAVEAYQWQAFVGQCQASANGRMVEGLALLLVGALFGLVLHPLVRRAWHEPAPAGAVPPPAPQGEAAPSWHRPQEPHGAAPPSAWSAPAEAASAQPAPPAPAQPGAAPMYPGPPGAHRWPPPAPESQQPTPPPGVPPAPPADQP